MQSHTDMTKNQNAKCRIDFSFLIVAFVVVSVASAGIAGRPAPTGKSITPPGEVTTLTFPCFAEITGDNVYFRSGPGRNFYECGKLNKGDKVKVVSQQFSWYEIVPPPKSFSWISMQFVDKDPENPGFGIVNGDRVRVYAGSDRIPRIAPHHSTKLQGKLKKGERVQLLGQPVDDHYKIAPQAFSYMWVSTHFSKPLPPTAKVEPTDMQPIINVRPVVKVPLAVKAPVAAKVPPTDKALPAGDVPAVVKFGTSTASVIVPAAVKPNVIVETVVLPGTRLEQYKALQEKIKAEKLKPTDEQDYELIEKALTEIVADKEAGDAAKYAKKVLTQVQGYQLVLATFEKLRIQKEQLSKKTAEIDEARTAKLAKIKDLGRFAVTGKFQKFTLFGPGNYRIVDEAGKMLCYALPSGLASKTDLTSLIGKQVGIVGTIQPHLPTKKAMVRFSEIVVLN